LIVFQSLAVTVAKAPYHSALIPGSMISLAAPVIAYGHFSPNRQPFAFLGSRFFREP